MALTDTQKSHCRRYMGVPDVSRQYDLRLESSMEALSPEGEVHVGALLTELEAIQTQLSEARACRLKVKVVEDIVMGHEDEIRTLWREGNRLAQDLGVALYFTPRRRPFGTRAASWSSEAGSAHVTRRG